MISFPKPDVEQYFRTYQMTHFSVNKDESKLVFSSNLNGSFNLWAMDLPNTYPYPLTFINQKSSFIKIDNNDRFILTGFDRDGDENYQIYGLPMEGGATTPVLTGESQDKIYYGALSKEGDRLYYVTSKDNPNFLNIRIYDMKSKKDKLLLKGEEATHFLAAISPDENSFVYEKVFSNTYILGFVNKGDNQYSLTPNPEEVHTVSEVRYVNNETVYFLTNYKSDFAYLAAYDLSTNTYKEILKIDKEDFKILEWHENTNTLFIVTEKGVTDYLYSYSIESEKLEKIETPVDEVLQLTIAESGNIYLLGRGSTVPVNIYMKEQNQSWQQLTDNRVLGISQSEMVEPEVIQYASFDSMNIEALLFKAKEEVANGYTIFWPHGGPQAAERKFFRNLFQYLIGRGYNIFAPNFRGSTGYGASFTKLVEGDWGEGPRLDCVAGMDWLFDQGISSPEKLFIVGGSYGGYMTLLLAGRHSNYFKAAVDIFGPSNLFTFIDSVPEHWKPIMKRWLGDPVEDKERLTHDSPITYLDQMEKPMLVIQGANDPRVVKAESDQIVAALQEKGLDVEYLVLDDEGHGFSKKENEIKVYRLILEFLERNK